MYKNKVIVFEGIEGSGKSYHVKNVEKFLKKEKIHYIKIREPGGSVNSEKIRKLILNKKSNFNKLTDLLLYLAARNENMINIINKHYRKKVILIDRFSDSTLAYQHYAMNINKNFITNLNNRIIKNFKVDLVFLNVVNKKNLQKRLKQRKSNNRYDNFKFHFYSKAQNGFLKIAKNKKKYQVINSNLSINDNKKLIINKVKKVILK